MRFHGRRALPVAAIILFGARSAGLAYQVNCSATQTPGNLFSPSQISSVFGEARCTGGAPCTPDRFHGGVDIPQCVANYFVRPILGGTVRLTGPFCGNTPVADCLRIESAGQSFDYEHVLWDTFVADGTQVTTSTVIGKIDPATPGGAHLHLNEIINYGGGTLRINPQFQDQLSYTDADRPDFSTATVGVVVDAPIVMIRAGTESNPQAFLYRNGEFYVNGHVDILVTGRNGSSRKGVFRVFTDADPIVNSFGVDFNPITTIAFGQMRDGQTPAADVQRVYWKRSSWADTYIPTNIYLGGGPLGPQSADAFWDTTADTAETRQVCVWLADHPPPQSHTKSRCEIVVVDNITPLLTLQDTSSNTFTTATSTNIVVVKGDDSSSGIYAIGLVGVSYSSWHYVNGVQTSASNTFPDSGALADGLYTAYVVDLASNVTSAQFQIDTTTTPHPTLANVNGSAQSGTVTSTNNVVINEIGPPSGIRSIALTGPGGYSAAFAFACASVAKAGPFALVVEGTYTATAFGCNGTTSDTSFFYSAVGLHPEVLCAVHPIEGGKCQFSTPTDPTPDQIRDGRLQIVAESNLVTGEGCQYELNVGGQVVSCLGGGSWTSTYTDPIAQTHYFSVRNSSAGTANENISITAHVRIGANDYPAGVSFSSGLASGGVIKGTVTIAEVGQTFAMGTTSMTQQSGLKGLGASEVSITAQETLMAARQGLAVLGTQVEVHGSEFALVRPGTMTFVALDPGTPPAIDTNTVAVYAWTGSSWSSTGIAPISVSKSTTTGVITVSARSARSGTFATLFSVTDASAPVTTWSIQGSSFGFQGTTFVSTYSYLVLSSTDPTVNGFASGVATTYYRIDSSTGDPYFVYTSSLSFLPGTHLVDRYSVDWAGNVEAVKKATITVTAGSVTKLSDDLQVDGNLLVGFLGSGAKAEVVAQAQYAYSLRVSSPDGTAMLAVDNANFASIGTAPASGRLTLAGVSQDTALALRSGNSNAAVTGAELAFGRNGSSNLRHVVYTQHGPVAGLNKMVFDLWTPASGSSATLGSFPVLALEGSILTLAGALAHVRPAGIADKELVVSDGSTAGAGNVLRWATIQPSASVLKQDIERLGKDEEERAWEDMGALKPAVYRRKKPGPDGTLLDDPGAPLERGYIFEETPESIRGGPGTLVVNERLANAELALKAAMRRLEELNARLKKLKEARR